jgi:hypothetical protein
VKIGITIDPSVAFWANGLQQNIVFLKHLLDAEGAIDSFYIATKDPDKKIKRGEGVLLEDLLTDDSLILDVLIVAGFTLKNSMYDKLKSRNPKLKIILVHFFNKFMDDIHYAINDQRTQKNPIEKPKHLSEIWILPHHEFFKEYIKCYYNFDNVKVVPYLWNSFFIDQKNKELSETGSPVSFQGKYVSRVCIFEPNISHIKNCITPIMICEKLEQIFPGTLDSVNVFCCDHIRKGHFFKKFMKRLSIVKNRENFCFFNNKWSTLAGLSRWGSTIVSSQTHNSLNYSHLEVLYLGIPLIHNSEELIDLGYYYPEFDIDMGAKQLKSAIMNHESVLEDYTKDCRDFIKQYDPKNINNINYYINLIKSIDC